MGNNIYKLRMLFRLYKIWKKNSDLRLGQLIENAFDYEYNPSFYYLSEDEFLYVLERFYKGG